MTIAILNAIFAGAFTYIAYNFGHSEGYRQGKIEFLSDCHHNLAGTTADMLDWDGWGGYE